MGSGWAVCVASRHMLITGYLWHANNAQKNLKAEHIKASSTNSWARPDDTYFTGKWHIRAKPDEIFTKAQNVRGGMPNQTKEGYNCPCRLKDPWDPVTPSSKVSGKAASTERGRGR